MDEFRTFDKPIYHQYVKKANQTITNTVPQDRDFVAWLH